MTKKVDYDLIIVGGGMVGATLALALQNSPLRIAIVEAFPIQSSQQPSYDDRGIALSYGSQRIFESIILWPSLQNECTPIKHVHVSDRGHFGVTRLSAEDEDVPALGQVITARALGQTLASQLNKHPQIKILCPAKVIDLNQYDDFAELTLANQSTLTTKLVVAADGAQSTIRQLLKLAALEHDYQQTAITANITPEQPHRNWAYERFTDTGPIALLPMTEQHLSLVWIVNTGDEQALLRADEPTFLEQLQDRFGYRLGQFKQAGQRNSYPLKLVQADQPVQHRVILIGNAAHNLHPIAGQGFNLGLRDVAALADVLANQIQDCGDAHGLTDYKNWRLNDQDNVIAATSNLVRLFSNNIPLLGLLRGTGLSLIEALPPFKHWLAKRSMGLAGRQPRLSRGIQLDSKYFKLQVGGKRTNSHKLTSISN